MPGAGIERPGNLAGKVGTPWQSPLSSLGEAAVTRRAVKVVFSCCEKVQAVGVGGGVGTC